MDGLQIDQFASSRSPDLRDLRQAAIAEDHGFVNRTISDWESGTNRFDRQGECFFLAHFDGFTVGMCGLNIDPYVEIHRSVASGTSMFSRASAGGASGDVLSLEISNKLPAFLAR